jgi:hypothetical protein
VADNNDGSSLARTRRHTNQAGTSRIRRLIPDSEDDDTFEEEPSASHDPSLISSDRTDLGLDAGQALDPSAASTFLSQVTERHKCTKKHFRIKRIIGRQVIENDAWYDVRWKRSWVPSHLVVRNEDGRDFIAIDGKDWYIKEIVKSKIKKGIRKQLVRWADDTQEPLLHLGKALEAVEAFEQTPNLRRRTVTFDESLRTNARFYLRARMTFAKPRYIWLRTGQSLNLATISICCRPSSKSSSKILNIQETTG